MFFIVKKGFFSFWCFTNRFFCSISIKTKDGKGLNFSKKTIDYRVFSLTWSASMQIYCNKRRRLHKKRVKLPQDLFGTPTWPPFHCFGTPIWPPWRHVKTLYTLWRNANLRPFLNLCFFYSNKAFFRSRTSPITFPWSIFH